MSKNTQEVLDTKAASQEKNSVSGERRITSEDIEAISRRMDEEGRTRLTPEEGHLLIEYHKQIGREFLEYLEKHPTRLMLERMQQEQEK